MKRHLSFAAGLLTLCVAAGWTIHLSVRNVSDYQGLDWENTKLTRAIYKKDEPAIFRRVIMIRWKNTATPVDVRAARDLWIGLSQKVNGFDNFSWLVNTHAGNSYYQHVAILDFTSVEARDEYEQHEDHKRLMELGNNVVEAVSEVDYMVK